MNDTDLTKAVADFTAKHAGAVDATGRAFEFGRTYYYFDGREVHSVQSRAHTLALRYFGTELYYYHMHGFDREDLKVALKDLFPSQESLVPAALLKLEAEKRNRIAGLAEDVGRTLSKFAAWGEEVAEVERKLRGLTDADRGDESA